MMEQTNVHFAGDDPVMRSDDDPQAESSATALDDGIVSQALALGRKRQWLTGSAGF